MAEISAGEYGVGVSVRRWSVGADGWARLFFRSRTDAELAAEDAGLEVTDSGEVRCVF